MFFLPSLTTLLPQWNKEGGFKKGQYPGLRMICESKGPLAMSLSVNRAHPSLMLSTLLAIITARVSYLFKLLCKNKKQPQFSLFETRAKPSQCNPCASLLKTARNLLKRLSIVWTRSLPFNLLSSHQSNHEQWDCQCLADGVGTANEAALQSSVYGGNDWLLQLIRNSTLPLSVFKAFSALVCCNWVRSYRHSPFLHRNHVSANYFPNLSILPTLAVTYHLLLFYVCCGNFKVSHQN